MDRSHPPQSSCSRWWLGEAGFEKYLDADFLRQFYKPFLWRKKVSRQFSGAAKLAPIFFLTRIFDAKHTP